MKIIVGIFSRNDHILHIEKLLKSLGHEVITVYTDAYRMTCSYYQKKLDKLGFHGKRKAYETKWKELLYSLVDSFEPNIILFINSPKSIMSAMDLEYIKGKTKMVCWFVDGVKTYADLDDYYPLFDDIYVFEKSDVFYLAEKFSIKAHYLPVGYNDDYKMINAQKNIDVVFVGSPFVNRLELLEKVAKYAYRNTWSLHICGPFYDDKYPWKKILFRRKYPYIFKYLYNGSISSKQAASLYARSKICLNIHDLKHKSPNPRTFEILATGSFELMDKREYYVDGLIPGKNIAIFNENDEIIKKIEYYLGNVVIRNSIAKKGFDFVYKNFSMRELINKICKNGDAV